MRISLCNEVVREPLMSCEGSVSWPPISVPALSYTARWPSAGSNLASRRAAAKTGFIRPRFGDVERAPLHIHQETF